MRYYIYIDKPFLRTIFASMGKLDFNIDVIEYSIKKSYTNNNNVALDPCIENGNNCEIFKDTTKGEKKTKNNSFNSKKIRFGYGKGVSCNIETERKYINISDISDMKNIGFYHKLINNIEEINGSRKDNRLYKEEGYITTYNSENLRDEEKYFSDNEGFFRINNTCIWYDKKKLQSDINLLSLMSCKIKVVGYLVNCLESSNKVVKALAIFIE